ncbi:MAG: hypothetical protein ACR2PL_06335 [Dehalococcoidia bacterium]
MNTDAAAETDLIDLWIEEGPPRPAGRTPDAVLKGLGIAVWALVEQLHLEHGDIASVAEQYELPHEAVTAVLAHYRRHRAAIDLRLEGIHTAVTS